MPQTHGSVVHHQDRWFPCNFNDKPLDSGVPKISLNPALANYKDYLGIDGLFDGSPSHLHRSGSLTNLTPEQKQAHLKTIALDLNLTQNARWQLQNLQMIN